MVQRRKVVPGKYYVNNARNIAREVVEVKDDAVIFITYHLDTNASSGNLSECLKQHFTHWADREATQTEVAGLLQLKM